MRQAFFCILIKNNQPNISYKLHIQNYIQKGMEGEGGGRVEGEGRSREGREKEGGMEEESEREGEGGMRGRGR